MVILAMVPGPPPPYFLGTVILAMVILAMVTLVDAFSGVLRKRFK